MGYLTLLLVAVLILSIAEAGSAEKYFRDLKVGNISASFNSWADGLSLSYDGATIIRESSLWVHNPMWNYHYYGFPHLKDDIKFTDIDGGKEILITHRSDSFFGVQRIVLKDNSASVELKYKLLKDIKDADMEYCFGKICAAPILGCPFNAVTDNGEAVQGVVPIQAKETNFSKTCLTPDPLTHIVIDSRVGKMTIDVTGDPAGITMMDYRLNQYEQVDKAPVFWAGILGKHLEYGKEYTQTVTIKIDPAAKPSVAAQAKPANATAEEKSELRSPYAGPVYVIPEPQDMKLTHDSFTLDKHTKIVVAKTATTEDYLGAKSFVEEIKLLYGFEPKIIHEGQVKKGDAVIFVGEASANKTLAAAALKEGINAPGKDEGYALKVTSKHVLVLGHDRKGSYYGMQTLKQLVKPTSKGAIIAGCVISDWPSLKYRGAHLFTGNEALPFHEKLIDRILSRYKMNNLLLEVDYIKWKTEPGLAVKFSEDQEDIKKELKYAHDHFMEVNPLLQSLGHSEWLFTNGMNKDLAENPARPYACCTTKPRYYDYIYKFYDETVKLFDNPKFIHIGHDEVNEPGGYPKDDECKKRSAEQIFVDDTLKIHDHLAKSGTRVMMWGDMLLARGDSPDATNAGSPEKAKWMRDQLPKDVLITDWHYAAADPDQFKSLGIFVGEGHDAIAATWYTPENIETFSKQAKNVGAMGLLQTTWAGYNSNETNIKENFIQFSAMILAAEFAWNSGKATIESLPYKADEEFRRQWDPKPINLTARRGWTLDLSHVYNVSLADNDGKTGWLGLGPQNDLSAVPNGEVRLGGDLFKLAADNNKPSALRLTSTFDVDRAYPEKIEIKVGQKAAALLFLQTCMWTDSTGRRIGAYRINYADGTSVEVPLTYGVNVASWIDRRSVQEANRVWNGRSKDNQRVGFEKMQWDNPNPEKVIASIEMTSAGTEAGPVLLAISGVE